MDTHLTFISGSKAGRRLTLGPSQTIGRGSGQDIRFLPNEVLVSSAHASITREGDAWVLRDLDSRNGTLVNGERVTERTLQPGDVIEFGPGGPSAQFTVGPAEAEGPPTVDVASRFPPGNLYREARARASAHRETGRHRAFSTTREFMALAYRRSSHRARRATIALALLTVIGFGAILAWQHRNRQTLESALSELAVALEAERGTRQLLQRDLLSIQTDYDSLLDEVEASRTALAAAAEARPETQLAETVNRDYGAGVALIVFSWGLVRRGGSELLRYQVGPGGQPLATRRSDGTVIPRVGFSGDGPPVAELGSATAFLIDSAGWMLTNRHVALPWEEGDALAQAAAVGLDVEPRFITLKAYFPPGDNVYDVVVERTSPSADVAVFRTRDQRIDAPVFHLAPVARHVPPGEQIVFLGYPTGVHNLLFRVDDDTRRAILEAVGRSPLALAAALAERHLIQPLVIGGTVADTTQTEVIHTAGTTGGGSGGPIVGTGERVVAIHYAAVRSPIAGDPFQTQRAVRIRFAWDILPVELRNRMRANARNDR